LQDSGYYRAETGPLTVLFDAGRLGPDHQLGHAQCDMLSFCLWVQTKPVIVHPGCFEYLAGPMREYCRSTASHNTLQIDGAEQAELWASHRVGRRGYPRSVEASNERGVIFLQGSHTGYKHLPGSPLHKRILEIRPEMIRITDEVQSSHRHLINARLHLHPDCKVNTNDNKIQLDLDRGSLLVECEAPIRIEKGWYCPEFGIRKEIAVLVAEYPFSKCVWTLSWFENITG
jgi:uncharacterized heparinase superfamily protein